MNKSTPINKKLTGSIILCIVFILFAQAYQSDLKNLMKTIFESGWLSKILWTYVICVLCFHRYLFASYELAKDSFMYKHFGTYADTLFGISTYGVAGSTSIALLKGLYMQTFFDGKHFMGFGTFDLISMFLLTSFLFVYCIFNTTILLKEIIFYSANAVVEVRT
ncbi:hypothetical protein [Vibrio caribbeanicus]|uniref:hypothetical protein n=1 Tax=Vibrio caribbeanicus TaxID=701175 RepID=UPI0030D8745A